MMPKFFFIFKIAALLRDFPKKSVQEITLIS